MRFCLFVEALLFSLTLIACSGVGFQASQESSSSESKSSVFGNSSGDLYQGGGNTGTINQPNSGGGSTGNINQLNGGGSGSGVVNQSTGGGSGNGVVNQPSGGGSGTGVVTQPVCTTQASSLDALENAIKTIAPPQDQSTTLIWAHGCAAGLIRFAAKAVDSGGQVVTSGQYSAGTGMQPHIGVYCYYNNGNNGIDLLVEFLRESNLRGTGIAATYFCKYGSDASSCSPSSVNFIAGITYGVDGAQFRESNIAGVSDANVSLSAASMVSQIQVPGQTFTDLSCQTVALWSPLVIEDVHNRGILTLNPSDANTHFDLDGDGVKSRISCVTKGSFLALPDQNGNITNINQLFGNNTTGPDGKKAPDGFQALGKYDHKSLADGYGSISAKDPVFAKLRLWKDSNCDGLATPSELKTLKEAQIVRIQWLHATPAIQIDPFGNETKGRSQVFQSSGQTLRMFDLWFKAY